MTHQNALNKRKSRITGKKAASTGRQAAKDVLLLSTAASISVETRERISRILNGSVDREFLWTLAEFHGVTPLIARNFIAGELMKSMPQPYPERFKSAYDNSLYRNIIISDELTRALASFRNHDIPAIVLKGTILAEQLYGNPGLRQVTDMDILVQPDKLSAAGSLLTELGYEQEEVIKTREHPFHEAPYRKQAQFPLVIELHWNIADPRLAAIPQEKIWQRAQRFQIQGGTVLVLSPEDTLLFLSNSFTSHNNHFLMSLCDITELLNKHAGTMDWDYAIDSAKSWQIATSVYFSLKLAQDLLGAPVPDSAVDALKPVVFRAALLNFLVNQENWISPLNNVKLRRETLILYRSLLMDDIRRTRLVISRYRGNDKWWGWLSSAIWAALVFAAAAGRNASDFICRRGK
jgi:hypothetical protein